MLVILRENVENLGRIGDVVNVSPGFARNYLLPRKLVLLADASNQQMIQNQKKALEKKRQAAKATLSAQASKIANVEVTLARRVGESDRLFGSVTQSDIVEGLKKLGHSVEKRMIELDQPIKALGAHSVTVNFDTDIAVSIKVMIVKEE